MTSAEYREWKDGDDPTSYREMFGKCVSDLAASEAKVAAVVKEGNDIKAEWNKWVQRNSTWVSEVITIQKDRDDEHARAEASEEALRRVREGLGGYCCHELSCLLAQWHEGRPTSDGGYETRYGDKWYRGDDKPPCTCGLSAILEEVSRFLFPKPFSKKENRWRCGTWSVGGTATHDRPPRGRREEMTGRDIHREWRDGMLNQGRTVADERLRWETLSEQDRELDERIARNLSKPVEAKADAGEREAIAKLLAKQETRGPATYEQFMERADEILALTRPALAEGLREADIRRILDDYDVSNCQNDIVRELLSLTTTPAPLEGEKK